MLIWMPAGQLQCCGDEFTIGSTVSWNVLPASAVPELPGLPIDGVEGHHADPGRPVEGTVQAIEAVHLGTSSVLRSKVPAARKWHPDRGPLRFAGYLARI